MKRAILHLTLAALAFVSILAFRLFNPPEVRSSDPEVNRLADRKAALEAYRAGLRSMEDSRVKVQVALWNPKQVDAFAAELPKDWNYRPISTERLTGVTMQRIALSKELLLRDYTEFVRVLKRLEARPGTRIDSVTLSIGADGKRFTSSLITATLPSVTEDTAEPRTSRAAPSVPAAPAIEAPAPAVDADKPAPMPAPTSS